MLGHSRFKQYFAMTASWCIFTAEIGKIMGLDLFKRQVLRLFYLLTCWEQLCRSEASCKYVLIK